MKDYSHGGKPNDTPNNPKAQNAMVNSTKKGGGHNYPNGPGKPIAPTSSGGGAKIK